jgi:crossover junction endodeoxyribonuclease RusA
MSADTARRTFRLEMPAGMALLSLNDRLHWSERNRRGQDLRKAMWAIAKRARIPVLERVSIVVEYQPPPLGRSRDADNLAVSGKYCIDGLVSAGVIPDDNSRHVTSVTCCLGAPFPKGRLVLHIEEVPGD